MGCADQAPGTSAAPVDYLDERSEDNLLRGGSEREGPCLLISDLALNAECPVTIELEAPNGEIEYWRTGALDDPVDDLAGQVVSTVASVGDQGGQVLGVDLRRRHVLSMSYAYGLRNRVTRSGRKILCQNGLLRLSSKISPVPHGPRVRGVVVGQGLAGPGRPLTAPIAVTALPFLALPALGRGNAQIRVPVRHRVAPAIDVRHAPAPGARPSRPRPPHGPRAGPRPASRPPPGARRSGPSCGRWPPPWSARS